MGLRQNPQGFHHKPWSALCIPTSGNGGVFHTEGGGHVLQHSHGVEFAGFRLFWGGGWGHLLVGGKGWVWGVGMGVGSNASQEEGAEGGEGGGVGSKCLGFMMGKTHRRGR